MSKTSKWLCYGVIGYLAYRWLKSSGALGALSDDPTPEDAALESYRDRLVRYGIEKNVIYQSKGSTMLAVRPGQSELRNVLFSPSGNFEQSADYVAQKLGMLTPAAYIAAMHPAVAKAGCASEADKAKWCGGTYDANAQTCVNAAGNYTWNATACRWDRISVPVMTTPTAAPSLPLIPTSNVSGGTIEYVAPVGTVTPANTPQPIAKGTFYCSPLLKPQACRRVGGILHADGTCTWKSGRKFWWNSRYCEWRS